MKHDQRPVANLDAAQLSGQGDMRPEDFRVAAHRVVDLMADYLDGVERYPVLPQLRPGELRARFPAEPPLAPESIERILADYVEQVEPNVTHWQHPGFLGYFPSTASGPGILGEMLMASLVGNAMLWRTSPVATELEQVTVDWLRQGLGLPPDFTGFYTDTASTSTLIALAAARQLAPGDASRDGLAGRSPLRVYLSEEAHSSVEKAAMTLGIGRAGVRRIATNDRFEMEPEALAAAIADDRRDSALPVAVVSTIGTTSSTSVDPTAEIAEIARREGLWLHVDAAYAGVAALLPDGRAPFVGWENADSIVANPHKWLFTPLDCSLFLTRQPAVVRSAFSLVPEYLRTLTGGADAVDFNEYTPQLGRRFRALKMWILIRYFGLDGLRARIANHLEQARRFERWVEEEPDAELLAPVPFSTLCLRWRPHGVPEGDRLDALNERLMAEVNASGRFFLSHTRLRGRFAIRVAIANLHTEDRHLSALWDLIRSTGTRLAQQDPP